MSNMLESRNPSNGEVGTVPITPADTIPAIVARAQAASRAWREIPLAERREKYDAVVQGLELNARLTTLRNTMSEVRDGVERDLPPKSTFEVRAGDRVRVETPGGAGWGE